MFAPAPESPQEKILDKIETEAEAYKKALRKVMLTEDGIMGQRYGWNRGDAQWLYAERYTDVHIIGGPDPEKQKAIAALPKEEQEKVLNARKELDTTTASLLEKLHAKVDDYMKDKGPQDLKEEIDKLITDRKKKNEKNNVNEDAETLNKWAVQEITQNLPLGMLYNMDEKVFADLQKEEEVFKKPVIQQIADKYKTLEHKESRAAANTMLQMDLADLQAYADKKKFTPNKEQQAALESAEQTKRNYIEGMKQATISLLEDAKGEWTFSQRERMAKEIATDNWKKVMEVEGESSGLEKKIIELRQKTFLPAAPLPMDKAITQAKDSGYQPPTPEGYRLVGFPVVTTRTAASANRILGNQAA